ncbi:MAG: hypothetical protein R3F49_23500 [Planctomycetota bacterium]
MPPHQNDRRADSSDRSKGERAPEPRGASLGDTRSEPRHEDLETFEPKLRRALEQRAVRSARAETTVSASEQRQLDWMAEHMRMHPVGATTAAQWARDPAASTSARLVLRSAAIAAAAALCVLLWRAVPTGRAAAVRPASGEAEVYLGGREPSRPGGNSSPETLPALIEWDPGAWTGFVRVAVFDLALGTDEPVVELQTQARSWRPEGPLPARCRVIVDHAGDDEFTRPVLLCADFVAP